MDNNDLGRVPSEPGYSAEPEPVSTHSLGPSGEYPSRIERAFHRRLDIYRMKHESADPFADDCYNRWEATRYVIEAIEILAEEAGIVLRDSDRNPEGEDPQGLRAKHESAGP